MLVNHYMKAAFAGIVLALVVTGLNIVAGLLIKWFNGDPVGQLVTIKHLIVFLSVLALSSSYLSTREPDDGNR